MTPEWRQGLEGGHFLKGVCPRVSVLRQLLEKSKFVPSLSVCWLIGWISTHTLPLPSAPLTGALGGLNPELEPPNCEPSLLSCSDIPLSWQKPTSTCTAQNSCGTQVKVIICTAKWYMEGVHYVVNYPRACKCWYPFPDCVYIDFQGTLSRRITALIISLWEPLLSKVHSSNTKRPFHPEHAHKQVFLWQQVLTFQVKMLLFFL